MIELGNALPLLFGHDPEEGIVSVATATDATMTITTRAGSNISSREVPFYPFFFLSEPRFIEGFQRKFWLKQLDGNHWYRFICAFSRLRDMWDAVHFVLQMQGKETGKQLVHYSQTNVILLRPDPVIQFLLQSGKTFYKGMKFSELRRLQLDIETYASGRFSIAAKPSDRIILITLSDSTGWEYTINGKDRSEPEMIEELNEIILERDPDIIEGHNIIGFDLPYLEQRAQLHGIELRFGRNGQRLMRERAPHLNRYSPRIRGDTRISPYKIPGREIVDTLLLVQNYDASKRILETYTLKYVAQYFGLASKDRVYVPGDRISWYWDHEPEILVKYALDDVRETRALSEHLTPIYFYLSQIVPLPLSQTISSGTATKIELLMMREYLRRKHSLPQPEPPKPFPGGYTDTFLTGIVGPVLHVDVESLYPSIMLANRIKPSRDDLDVFLALLDRLTALRLDYKNAMRKASNPQLQSAYDTMQSSLKILINSFYGYLGYARGLFNDYDNAARVTQLGRELLQKLIAIISELGGDVVEVDTDGVYFVPPSSFERPERERDLLEMLSARLPMGIRITLDGRYQRILSYKKKNYALLDEKDRTIIKGSSLISRSMEQFLRNYILQWIKALFRGDIPALRRLYISTREALLNHRIDIRGFARTEVLHDSLETYQQEVQTKARQRTAIYELALKSGRPYKVGSRISYYITGTDPNPREFENCKLAEEWVPSSPDENSAYYVRRLDEATKKFEVFFEKSDWEKIFNLSTMFETTEQELRSIKPVNRSLRSKIVDDDGK
ncbi:MAG: DNA polymerase domain-containing protein [Bacteroidota bacterium]